MNVAELRNWISAHFWDSKQVASWAEARFFRRRDHQQTSSGTGSGTLPIITLPTGKIDNSFLDISETIADTVGAMVTGNTETDIAVTYQDADNTIDFVVNQSMVGEKIHAATAKTTPVDADTMPLIDSAAANALKKVTWANVKATLKTYLDTLYVALTGNQTVAGVKTFTDLLRISGSVIYGIAADASGRMYFQAQNSINPGQFWFLSKDSDGTDNVSVEVWAKGTPAATANRERLIVGYDAANLLFNLNSEANGTGTVRPLVFRTGSNLYQVYLDTDGNVGIGLQNNPTTAIDILLNAASSGGIIVKNENGTVNGHTRVMIDVPAGAGDAFTLYTIGAAATEAWAVGIDNSDSDTFKISDANNLGTNDRLKISSGGVVTLGNGVNPVALYVDGAAGSVRDLAWLSAGSSRWIIRTNSTAESGSDAGSNLEILSRTDAGAAKSTVLQLVRSTGAANFSGTITATGINVGEDTMTTFDEVTNFTPTITGSGINPAVTYTAQICRYLRVNDWIHFQCQISWSSASGGSGNARFTLPVACGALNQTVAGWYALSTIGVYPSAFPMTAGNSYGSLYVPGTDNTVITVANVTGGSGGVIYGGSYYVGS